MTEHSNQTPLSQENCVAALDIGSNSFHFILARIVDEQLQVLHSEKYTVKLADGLNNENYLSQEAMNRGLETLRKLAITTEQLSSDNFRIVATYTLRKAKNAHQFLAQAQKVFPFDIEVISGHEEARLIYQGVSHYVSSNTKNLVLDIGGGSTECIVGENNNANFLDSLNIGCVSFARNYFLNGTVTQTAFNRAILHASVEIEAVSARFTRIGWQMAYGTSGTIKSIYHVINADNELSQPITLEQLYELQHKLIAFGHVERFKIKGLKEARRNVLCSGLSILTALMKVLQIKELNYCDYSLREGVIFGLLEQKLSSNIHERTIKSLISRFNIDKEQADRVQGFAKTLFEQVSNDWNLSGKHYLNLLNWAISLHEIGLDINPSGFHRHGKYILENADLAGFNQEQVQAIAWLVGNQRKKIQSLEDLSWFIMKPVKLASTLVILRLACLLSKQRQLSRLPVLKIKIKDDKITCYFPEYWLEENPVLAADLLQEAQQLINININLTIQ